MKKQNGWRLCAGCQAGITEADSEAGQCTQCGWHLKEGDKMKSELIDALVASGEFRVVALADALPPQRYGTPEYKATLNSTWERDYLPDEQLGMPFAVCLKYVDDMGMSLRGEIGGLQAMERPDLAAALAQFDVEQLRDWLAFYCDEGGVK